jgi:hypothetical protein
MFPQKPKFSGFDARRDPDRKNKDAARPGARFWKADTLKT